MPRPMPQRSIFDSKLQDIDTDAMRTFQDSLDNVTHKFHVKTLVQISAMLQEFETILIRLQDIFAQEEEARDLELLMQLLTRLEYLNEFLGQFSYEEFTALQETCDSLTDSPEKQKLSDVLECLKQCIDDDIDMVDDLEDRVSDLLFDRQERFLKTVNIPGSDNGDCLLIAVLQAAQINGVTLPTRDDNQTWRKDNLRSSIVGKLKDDLQVHKDSLKKHALQAHGPQADFLGQIQTEFIDFYLTSLHPLIEQGHLESFKNNTLTEKSVDPAVWARLKFLAEFESNFTSEGSINEVEYDDLIKMYEKYLDLLNIPGIWLGQLAILNIVEVLQAPLFVIVDGGEDNDDMSNIFLPQQLSVKAKSQEFANLPKPIVICFKSEISHFLPIEIIKPAANQQEASMSHNSSMSHSSVHKGSNNKRKRHSLTKKSGVVRRPKEVMKAAYIRTVTAPLQVRPEYKNIHKEIDSISTDMTQVNPDVLHKDRIWEQEMKKDTFEYLYYLRATYKVNQIIDGNLDEEIKSQTGISGEQELSEFKNTLIERIYAKSKPKS